MTENNQEILYEIFRRNIEDLNKSNIYLKKAYIKSLKISIKTDSDYNDEEFEQFESLTSRFSRSSDLLTQKVVKTLFKIIKEHPKTFLDAANLLEKLDICSADSIIEIREHRNRIAHEYETENLNDLILSVFKYTPQIELISRKLIEYAESLKIVI